MKAKASEQEIKWLNISTNFIASEEGKKVAGHVVDISSKLAKIREINSGESDNLEDILHIMAHDLRSPIGNIMNIADIQQDCLEEKNYGDAISYAQIVHRISREMNILINSMIEMVELRSQGFILKKSKTDIIGLVDSVIKNYAIDIKNKDIKLKINFPDEDIQLALDPVKFRLVIQNLLSNAVKFTKEEGEINISVDTNGDQVLIKVSDTGVGIPRNKQNEIFKRFTTLKRSGTNGEKSNGLGLSITKKIVELHEGDISVKSKRGKGSTFTVGLPKN